MIRVNKYDDNVGEQLSLKFENNNVLNINLESDLNLYFTPESEEKRYGYSFQIDPNEDEDLYNIFNKLYERISKYNISGEVDRDFKKQDKKSNRPLVKDGIIEWLSDGMDEKNASRLLFYKQSGKLFMFLEEGRIDKDTRVKSVKIDTKNSRYKKFFIPFIELYGDLCFYVPENQQITMDEYLLTIRKR